MPFKSNNDNNKKKIRSSEKYKISSFGRGTQLLKLEIIIQLY